MWLPVRRLWLGCHARHDANDLVALADAYQHALSVKDRPKLIIVDSHIGFGSPHRQDTKEAHGEPLGEEEVKLTKRAYGWPEDAKFLVPDGVRENFRDVMGKRGSQLSGQWNDAVQRLQRSSIPTWRCNSSACSNGKLPDGWDKELPTFRCRRQRTRDPRILLEGPERHRQERSLADGRLGRLVSIDQNAAHLRRRGRFRGGHYNARNFHFGIREHAMGAIVNGMALSKIRAYGSTFLIFSDYMKMPIRLSAIMEIPASGSSPMIPLASAKTDRPTSRSSNW